LLLLTILIKQKSTNAFQLVIVVLWFIKSFWSNFNLIQ